MVARSNALQSEAGYIDARPQSADRQNLLQRAAGPYIRVISPPVGSVRRIFIACQFSSITTTGAVVCGRPCRDGRSAVADAGSARTLQKGGGLKAQPLAEAVHAKRQGRQLRRKER